MRGPLAAPVRRVLDLARLAPAPGPPVQVHLSVTDRCFLPCIHCDVHRSAVPDLPTTAWIRFLDTLAAWGCIRAANVAGGEPLLRRDLEEILSHAVRQGMDTTFNTNGWLVTAERARRLAATGASIAYVSIDGAREATHDRTRGRTGAFRRARAAVGHLRAAGGPRVVIAAILHGENAVEIPDLLAWVEAEGLQLVVQPLWQNFGDAPWHPGWYRSSPLWPRDLGPVDAALDRLADRWRAGGPVCNTEAQLQAMKDYFRDPSAWNGRACRAGRTDLAVDPRGNVRLCFFLEPVGSILGAARPEAVWTGPAALRRRWEVARCRRPCSLLNCNFS